MHLTSGRWARGRRRGRDRQERRRQVRLRGRRHARRSPSTPASSRSRSSASRATATSTRSAARPSRSSTCRRRRSSFARQRGATTISVAAKHGVAAPSSSRELRRLVPATAQVRTGADQAAKDEKDVAGFVKFIRYFLVGFGMVALFVGALRDLQHALDHRRAADARARDAADARRLATAGAALRRARGVRDRRSSRRSSASSPASGSPRGSSSLFSALGLALPEAGLPIETRTIVVPLLVGTRPDRGRRPDPGGPRDARPADPAVREGSAASQGRGGRTGPIVAAVLGRCLGGCSATASSKHGIAGLASG